MLDVAVLQRRQAERPIAARIFLVADAHERRLQQTGHCRQDLSPRQAGQPQVRGDTPAQRRQRLAEPDHARVLRAVALLAPARVIPILLAPAGVPPRRLQVAVGLGTDPDAGPGGRDRQLADAFQGDGVDDAATIRMLVDELRDQTLALPQPLPGGATPYAGPPVIHVPKPSRPRGGQGVGCCVRNRCNLQGMRGHSLLKLRGRARPTRPARTPLPDLDPEPAAEPCAQGLDDIPTSRYVFFRARAQRQTEAPRRVAVTVP